MVAVVGDAAARPSGIAYRRARAAGRLLVDGGYRVATGGLRGVMEAASRGAHESHRYREGDTVGLLPDADPGDANPWVDIVLPTRLGLARNVLVASTDALLVVGGGAGTLSEVAFAWMYRRPIVALDAPGWSRDLAGQPLDHRGPPGRAIAAAATAAEAVRLLAIALREPTE